MSDLDTIRLRGVRQNNLRGFDLDLTKRSLVVVVGVSGSGKSSLVFDTIAAEAQRQINATFSTYAQSHLPAYSRPDADQIENLPAAIIVDQRRLHGGPRSTVATITDIGSRLRMLFARGASPAVGPASAFSFNDPAGMCPRCQGTGVEKTVDEDTFVDGSRSLREGPFRHPDYAPGKPFWRHLVSSGLFDVDVPVEQYSRCERALLLDAVPDDPDSEPSPRGRRHEGALARFRRVQLSKDPATLKGEARTAYDRLVRTGPCSECQGTRLNRAARSAVLEGVTLPEVHATQVADLAGLMRTWRLGALTPVVLEVATQLDRMVDLGLGYLHLGRETSTLSGGEAQRVKMVRHLGSTLNDILYIFDEPTTGLHARDVERLAQMLQALRDKGNSVVVVEHDPAIMRIADQIVEIGPGAGVHGGRLVFQGSLAQLQHADTPTGAALTGRRGTSRHPRQPTGLLHITGASSNNLQDLSVDLPLGVLTVVSGVAGSGKSTLIRGHLPSVAPDAVLVDQAPIRGSRRSSVASWTGMLDHIRRVYATGTGQPVALFSPNSDGGCRACGGTGITFIDLGFADTISTPCETCEGRRFRAGVLRHQIGGLSIADVFDLTVEEAGDFFDGEARLGPLLERTAQVGLDYLALGQSLTALSGGERQRLKLARELTDGAPVIVLDEPTTGLHPQDVDRLLALLQQMVDGGRTVIVIEHDLDVIAGADHVIDLGPEGGHDGGRVQYSGTVDGLMRSHTHTGRYLRERCTPHG